MKYAITGGTGFVGRALARELIAGGHEVVAVSRRNGVDVRDEAALNAALAGCDGVAHCAGINRELTGQRYADVHVEGTRRVVAAARAQGVPRVALMSFLRARPDCGSPYHKSKWAAEEIVRSSGLTYTILKPGVIHGRGDHLLDHLSRALHTFPVFGLVGARPRPMRPVAVEDVARVLAAGLGDERLAGKTVAVTGPTLTDLAGVVRKVGRVVGKQPLLVPLPVAAHRALALVLERTMRVPLVSLAQVRILSESLAEPWGEVDALPADLAPRVPFDAATIASRLPRPGAFRPEDFRLTACPR